MDEEMESLREIALKLARLMRGIGYDDYVALVYDDELDIPKGKVCVVSVRLRNREEVLYEYD